MTTIDHQQAAVEAMIEEAKNHRWLTIPDERQECDCGFVISAFPLEYGEDAYKSHVAETALAAATPHLRAGMADEILDDTPGSPLTRGYQRLMDPKPGEHPVRTWEAAVRVMLDLLLEGGDK